LKRAAKSSGRKAEAKAKTRAKTKASALASPPAPRHVPAAKRAPAWAWILGTWFGSGLSPIVPGTAGTAASLPLAWVLGALLPLRGAWSPWCLVASLLLFYPAVLAAGRVELALGKHDPGAVVVDETLGTLLTMAFLPASAFHQWQAYVAAFFLFRILDVWKPGVIGRSQSLAGGWGIVIDDVLAGLLGGALLGLLWWLELR
jgi:phosphatidylglycerophosphatase A